MKFISKLRNSLGIVRFMRPLINGHTHLLLSQFNRVNQNKDYDFSDRDHIKAAADWLCRAQDATPDGGVVGRYRQDSGWTSSYPETTGYIVPTFLKLADFLDNNRYKERAKDAIQFLLDLQLQSGAFPGLEVHENLTEPSPFNSGQIINGLMEWHLATGDQEALDAAVRAADWILSVQDEDGAFRQYYYGNLPATYSSHLTCWLAQIGHVTGNERFLVAVNKHIDWVLKHVDPETGWIDLAGFNAEQHEKREGFTHTIAYTLWGLLYSGRILQRQDALDVVTKASAAIARRLELANGLPGLLDWKWRSQGKFACLTGNAQMALIWMELYKSTGDLWWLNPAFKALDEVKKAQPMTNKNSCINGGIAGSFPIWGDYIFGAFPNWAVKYFIDAMMEKETILRDINNRPSPPQPEKPDLPTSLPKLTSNNAPKQSKIIVLTRANSLGLEHRLSTWESRGIKPDALVFETVPDKPLPEKILTYISDYGIFKLIQRIFGVKTAIKVSTTTPHISMGGPDKTAAEYCREKGLKTVTVGSLMDPQSWEKIKTMEPDLLIQGGVGIIREGLCQIPSLGIVNVHMSILPFYRGMNVAEWARLNSHKNGCTVHLITDRGIDTGDILLTREIKTSTCKKVADLRYEVDIAQRELMADVVEYVVKTGQLPPRIKQSIKEGRQYYQIQSDLLAVLEEELLNGSKSN